MISTNSRSNQAIMQKAEDVGNEIGLRLQKLFPNHDFRSSAGPTLGHVTVQLPSSEQNDYSFELYVSWDRHLGEVSGFVGIEAILRQYPRDRKPRRPLWLFGDFDSERDDWGTAIDDVVHGAYLLLTSQSRIIRRRIMFLRATICEIAEGESWVPLGRPPFLSQFLEKHATSVEMYEASPVANS